ncbi:hypothetical protein [Nocardioides sp. BYT-33-1]|uniref:hypothetical protein n=1 Tax=Nocardioides sp. BYT-33-1 TaxID=3416952 RepID=UPI003F538D65
MASTHAWDNLTHEMREEMHDLTHFATVDAAHQGRVALWATFTVLPILWGLDMMTTVVTDSATWEGTISTWADNLLPGSTADAVMWVGAITLVIGVLVAALPQFGGDVLGIWFAILAVNLFSVEQMAFLGLGMAALAVCCFAMARMMRGDHRREV